MSRDKQKVVAKVKEWEKARDDRRVLKAGETWTVAAWLRHWTENVVAPPVITENAWIAYDVAVRVHLIPAWARKLDRLEPEHLEELYRAMTKAGAKPGRVHQVHRTIRAALNEAVRHEKLVKNPALLARAPKVKFGATVLIVSRSAQRPRALSHGRASAASASPTSWP